MEAAAMGDESTPVVEELYRLTDRLYRAETPNDVYEAALDAITRAARLHQSLRSAVR